MITDFIYTFIMVNQIQDNNIVVIFIYKEFESGKKMLSVKLTFYNAISFLANKWRWRESL